MSLFAALTTAVGGLAAQSSAIGNVSDNLANTQTTGFKGIDTQFESLVTQSNQFTNDPGGVRATPHYQNGLQGSLIQSSSSTSLAISGQGFFNVRAGIVNADGSTSIGSTEYFTRAGDFTLDKNGYLVNGAGFYLTGYPVNTDGNVQSSRVEAIMLSALLDNPVATSGVSYSANLPASAASTVAEPYEASPSTIQIYDNVGGTHTLSLTWTKAPSDAQATASINEGIDLTAKNAGTDGNDLSLHLVPVLVAGVLNSYTAEVYDGATLLHSYTGLPITQTAGSYDLWEELSDQINADSTSLISAAIPTTYDGTVDPAGFATTNLSGGLDSGANPNLWYLDVTVPGGGGVVAGSVLDYTATIPFTFNSSSTSTITAGTIQTITPSTGAGASGTYTVGVLGDAEITIPLDFTGSALTGIQSISIDFGTYNSSSTGVTQFADANNTVSVSSFEQNGIPRGSFQSLEIDKNGFVSLNYDNGQNRIISQIPIVQFFAQDQLQRVSGGAYLQTLSSGSMRRGAPGTNGAGTIVSNSLESSNVDIANEFTKLIQAQRVYSANARTITTADNMLQEVINIIR